MAGFLGKLLTGSLKVTGQKADKKMGQRQNCITNDFAGEDGRHCLWDLKSESEEFNKVA